MFILATTSSLIQVVTGSSGAVSVHATYVDNASGTITPNYQNTTSITTATTTTVVGSPNASIQRNIQTLIIHNTSGSVSNLITVQHTDGTNVANVYSSTLQVGEMCQFVWGDGWKTFDTNGSVKTTLVAPVPALVPFTSGTAVSGFGWGSYVPVTSTTSGNKTVTLPTATGSLKTITVTDRGALAANPSNNITVSGTTINGMSVINIANMSLTFIDAASGQIDSI